MREPQWSQEVKFDLYKCLDQVKSQLEDLAAKKNLRLIFSVDSETPKIVKGDSVRLSQILTNLINNAVKFTEKGFVEVRVKIASESPKRIVLQFDVEDTGIGIKKEDMTKLFKLFGFLESTKELNTKGIGLGLHITKKITKMFDGNIVCHSNYGHGSNFIFIVAIGKDINDLVSNYHCDRIMNPE